MEKGKKIKKDGSRNENKDKDKLSLAAYPATDPIEGRTVEECPKRTSSGQQAIKRVGELDQKEQFKQKQPSKPQDSEKRESYASAQQPKSNVPSDSSAKKLTPQERFSKQYEMFMKKQTSTKSDTRLPQQSQSEQLLKSSISSHQVQSKTHVASKQQSFQQNCSSHNLGPQQPQSAQPKASQSTLWKPQHRVVQQESTQEKQKNVPSELKAKRFDPNPSCSHQSYQSMQQKQQQQQQRESQTNQQRLPQQQQCSGNQQNPWKNSSSLQHLQTKLCSMSVNQQQQQQPQNASRQQPLQGGEKLETISVPGLSIQQQRPPQSPQPLLPGQPAFQPLRTPSNASSSSSMARTPRGTIGKPGIIETNYLRLDLTKMPDMAYHYDVTITPDHPKKFLRPAFEEFNRKFFGNIPMAYDGIKSCYTATLLSIKNEFEEKILLEDGGRSITFKIVVKATGNSEIDLRTLRTYHTDRVYDKPMRAMQCLDVVLASACHNLGIRSGRSFYNTPDVPVDLKDGFELHIGLYQAMILGDEPFLNVDISHKSFPKGISIIQYLQANQIDYITNKRPLRPTDRHRLKDHIKNLRIVYRAPKCFGSAEKEFTVHDITEESADRKYFTLDDGQKKSVADYFNDRGCKLQYPYLNCLIVGSMVKNISLPIEFCTIKSGQSTQKKDNPKQVSAMIKYAATSTNIRKRKIMELLNKFRHDNSNIVQSFGIRIGNSFIDVPMRLLNSPTVEYFGRKTIMVRNGCWRLDDNVHYLNPPNKLHKWAIIYHNQSRSINFISLQKGLVQKLLIASKGHNLKLEEKPFIDAYDRIEIKLNELKKEKFDLVVVIIPNRGTTYAEIKQAAEIKVGILTQCIRENTRCDMMTANNILLKINAKLNGTNHKIDTRSNIQLRNVMFMGCDVTHPSPDQKHIPSVVGVTASYDPNGACYNMQYRLQKSTLEDDIEDMESIFIYLMYFYKDRNKMFPEHIIYYRDGVSDGQFPKLKQNELRKMRSACLKLKIRPKITCIVVVKRHHTRFFPKTQMRDKFNNVEPGTVVDKIIVHPNEVQFFMVSHQSIQGTAKPTRYNVIVDDAKMDIDDLQKLTNNLCHLFPRCNRAVSYPTPVYLAHLVAARGRVYLEGTSNFSDLSREYKKREINEIFMSKNPMFFV